MPVEADLRTFMAADATIASLVSTRIYATDIKPQESALPAITYQRVGTEDQFFVDSGQGGYTGAEFDIDAWGEDYSDAVTLRDAIIARLQNYRGAMGDTTVDRIYRVSGPFDVYEDPLKQYRSTIGVQVFYNT